MAKKNNKKAAKKTGNLSEPIELKPLIIVKAVIKDGYCNYTYKEQTGVNAGDKHAVTGQGLVHADMMNAFGRLNVHLAMIDDAFITSGVEVKRIDDFHDHALTGNYDVDSFEVIGTDDTEKCIIKGTKFSKHTHDRMTAGSPRIGLAENSSHAFASDLKQAIELCRYEVELYKQGKHAPVEDEDPNQLEIQEFSDADLNEGAL